MRASPGSFQRTTFGHRCPACGQGPLFIRGYRLHAACGQCGMDLEGQHGAHYGGPIIVGYAAGGLAGLGTFALLFWLLGYSPWVLWVAVLAAVVAILLTFRHCKAFWTWWLYATGELPGTPPRRGAPGNPAPSDSRRGDPSE